MKLLIALVALLPPAAAKAADCSKGIQGPLTLVEWSAELGQRSTGTETAELSFKVENKTGKNIIAVEASISAFDPLDRYMFSISIPDVPTFNEVDLLTIEGSYGGAEGLVALAKLPRESVTLIVCTSRAAYLDGTTEEFK